MVQLRKRYITNMQRCLRTARAQVAAAKAEAETYKKRSTRFCLGFRNAFSTQTVGLILSLFHALTNRCLVMRAFFLYRFLFSSQSLLANLVFQASRLVRREINKNFLAAGSG